MGDIHVRLNVLKRPSWLQTGGILEVGDCSRKVLRRLNAKKKKKNGIVDLSVVESHYGMYGMLSVMVVTAEVAVMLYQVQQ